MKILELTEDAGQVEANIAGRNASGATDSQILTRGILESAYNEALEVPDKQSADLPDNALQSDMVTPIARGKPDITEAM